MPTFWNSKTPAWKLRIFGYLCGLLGAIVLIISNTMLILYEVSGASSFLDASILPELRSLVRVYAFVMVPALGVALLVVPFAIRQYFGQLR